MLKDANTSLQIYATAGELAHAAAQHFAELAEWYAASYGRFTVALSGGSTPKALYEVLAAEPLPITIPWPTIYFFWGDERCVPPEHADSNYRLAYGALLSKVSVPEENIFRIPAEDENHERAAAQYAATLQQFFAAPLPRFDLIFLGLGADGHTASLFPGTAALQVNDRAVAANYVEKLQTHRITLTAAAINNARHVIFLVAGADKAAALREVLEGQSQPDLYPSQLIHPHKGKLSWLVDEAAASLLTR
jgi:6-phosphogluconolactonase